MEEVYVTLMKMERIQCTEHDGISFTNDYKLEV